MIFYICNRQHAYTQASLLLYYRADLQDFLRFVPYDEVVLLPAVARGIAIWSDMDRLGQAEIADGSNLSQQMGLEQPHLVQLNHPGKSLQRFDLLRVLRAEGINDFGVYRPDALPDEIRYPVFLRDEVGAAYKAPRLLQSRAELDKALAELEQLNFVRPMVVEFGSRPGSDGCYRKYSAYRIGDRSYAQHCFASAEWFIKDPGRGLSGGLLDEHLAYVRDNPHAAALMPIFERAGISYGRVDYTIVDGRIQVFEINTNPTVLSYPPTPFDTYDSMPYANMHADALLALQYARDPVSTPQIDRTHFEILDGLRGTYRKRRRKLIFRKGLKFVRNAVLGAKS